MVDEDQLTARPQDPDHLVERRLKVRDGAEAEGKYDGVEGLILEGQRVCVASSSITDREV